LSERLYDAARDAQSRNLERALQVAERSAQRGLLDDAKKQERRAWPAALVRE
jgi:hypothetical protein